MFEISRILAPVVFSENCRGALKYASTLAARFGAEITVLHVLEPLTSLDFDTTGGLDNVDVTRRQWVHRSFQDFTFGIRTGVSMKEACVDGDPAREIVKFAESLDADLIVIATRGHGPFRRFLLGSVTAKVLHDAQCPVWTGAHMDVSLAPGTVTDRFARVLCAVDCGPQSEAALEWASGIAASYGAAMTILHVLSPVHDPERQRTACEEAQHRIERWRAEFNADAEVQMVAGNVADEVGQAVKRVHADLLVIGRGHIQGGGRLRSTSYSILRESPCPVVSV